MYALSDKQIDYIINDIRARGVEIEDLKQNLLDHICCIIENELEENGDFERLYQKTIRTFYKDALWEIEEETLSLLTFKHYYTMKKLMIFSGAFSVLTLSIGLWFKFMYWPGATFFVVLGILTGALLFLPLLFTLKAKEQQTTKDKFVMGIGALGVILISLSFLFRVMHWPHSIDLVYVSAAIMLLIFLPIYFFSGIRRPETKLNTVTTSMLVILVYGLLFMMIRPPRATAVEDLNAHSELGKSMEILFNEERLTPDNTEKLPPSVNHLNEQILKLCEESKTYIFSRDFGIDTAATSHYREYGIIEKIISDRPFELDENFQGKLEKLSSLVKEYNLEVAKLKNKRLSRIEVMHSILDESFENYIHLLSTANVMNQLIQVQMLILQNSRTLSLVAMK